MRILLPTLHVRPSAQAIPLAAACLKACLPENLRQTTELLDLFPSQSDGEIRQQILARQPEVVVFPLYLWNRQRLLKLCRQLRQQRPQLILLAGGPEASADCSRVIAEGNLDAVLCGEGEAVFPQVIAALAKQQPLDNIPGCVPAGSAGSDASAAVCADLSQLPSPWLQGDLSAAAGGGVLWEVARGCRFNCAFCYDAKGLEGVRPLPMERLTAELELFAEHQVAQVWILDSTFNFPAERGKQLLRLLLDKAPQIHYHLEAKADFLDRETAELLAQLSCSVQIGLQSAAAEILKPLHRNINQRQLEQQLYLLNQAGVTFGLDLIYGLPGDSHAGFCRSLDFALQQQPNQVDIFPLAVLPGTELHQRQQNFGISAATEPPYQITNNRSYSASDLQRSAELAAATDIFYNRGRAVGIFQQLCQALRARPSELLTEFSRWLGKNPDLSATVLEIANSWQPTEILPLQSSFIAAQLQKAKKKKLRRAALDLLNYHFLCAETLLAEDCQPATEKYPASDLRERSWRLNPQVHIGTFNYDLEALELLGGEPFEVIAKQLSPELSYGIFLRRNGEILIETLQEDFARMLLTAESGCRGECLLNELGELGEHEGLELLEFAISEGLLQPTT